MSSLKMRPLNFCYTCSGSYLEKIHPVLKHDQVELTVLPSGYVTVLLDSTSSGTPG